MKKKTIITSLALLAAAAMVGVGTSVGLTAIDTPDQVAAVKQDDDGTYLISTKEDLRAIFDGSAAHASANIRLTADIDMGGEFISNAQYGIDGTYTGDFDGNGHKITGINCGSTKTIFYFVSGKIHDVTFEFINNTGSEARVLRPLSHENNGTIENVTIVFNGGGNWIYDSGTFAYLAGSGTYKNCHAYYLFTEGANAVGVMFHETSGGKTPTVEDCTYGFAMLSGNAPANPWKTDTVVEGTSVQEELGYVYTDQYIEAVKGDEIAIAPYLIGSADGWGVEWTLSTEGIVTIENSSATNVDLTATAAGDVTLYGAYTKGDKSVETSINIHVDEPTGATGIAIDNKEEIKPTLEINTGIELSATIEGNSYDEAVWSSSNSDLIEVVQDAEDPLKATVTAKNVADEAVTITVEIKSAGASYSDSVEITPVPLQTFDINLLIEDTVGATAAMTGPVLHIMKDTSPSLKAYNTPTIWNPTSTEKANITIGDKTYYIIRQTVGVTEVGLHDASTLYFEYAFARDGTTGRVEITEPVMKADGTWNDVSVLINLEGHIEATDQGETEKVDKTTCTIYAGATSNNEVNEALDFAYNVIAPNWRDENGSMCHLLNNPEESEALTKITDAYTDDLSSEAKMVLNTISGGAGTSIGQSVQYLINNSKVTNDGSRVGIVNANKSLGTTAIVAIAVTTGAAALGLVYLALRKKSKKAE